jgi:hypothetical protein
MVQCGEQETPHNLSTYSDAFRKEDTASEGERPPDGRSNLENRVGGSTSLLDGLAQFESGPWETRSGPAETPPAANPCGFVRTSPKLHHQLYYLYLRL